MWDRLEKKEDRICLKQPDLFSCVISCAAMATGGTRQEVIDFIGMDGSEYDPDSKHPDKCRGISEFDIYKYLVHHNIYPGFLSATYEPTLNNAGDYEAVLISLPIKSYPALVSVKSKRLPEGNTHMTYWDGERLLDPAPGFCGDLNDYEILSWTPLIRVEVHCNE